MRAPTVMGDGGNRPIYLDNNATTRLDPEVFAAMLPCFTEVFGNPSSGHIYGWEAEAAIDQSRATIARSIGAEPNEIIFTSGATEANNLAIKGVAEAYLDRGRHLITIATEHSAVLAPCRYLETVGFEVTVLPVGTDGLLELGLLEQAIRSDTILVSVMAANNEIGVIQPLAAIGSICHRHGLLFHSDAAQAIGKIPLDVTTMQLDLMSLTAHKLHGPKGIGALYVRRKNPRVQLAPQLQGGGQERDRRSGTLATPQIVGFAAAIALALSQPEEQQRIQGLRDRLYRGLQDLGGLHLHGALTPRLAGNLNVRFEGVEITALMSALRPHVALSSGSACSTERIGASHVLRAIGCSEGEARSALRFGLGRFTTGAEIDRTIGFVREAVRVLRR
jgi:cysteine desulfurase